MLWLMILVIWAYHLVFGDTTASSRIAAIFRYLLIMLGLLRLLVQVIEVIEYTLTILEY